LGLIPSKGQKGKAPVKVLAGTTEEFTKAVHVKANAFSKTAKALIEQNGGKAEVV
jgi:ribosomal protein L15